MARQSYSTPQPPSLSLADKLKGIERLERRLTELGAFEPLSVQTRRSGEIVGLESSIEDTLAAVFGHGTDRFRRFRSAAQLEPPGIGTLTYSWAAARDAGARNKEEIDELRKQIDERKQRALALLKQAVQGLSEEVEQESRLTVVEPGRTLDTAAHSRKVFLVHGHDNDTKNQVARFLSKIGLQDIILHESANIGRHLLTKFQEESEGASFAVVLMTPDDEGGVPGNSPRKRARQNVVFELGFFNW